MKKTFRLHHSKKSAHRQRRPQRARPGGEGRWEFSPTSDVLFALGSSQIARRAAYRDTKGELRFLPL